MGSVKQARADNLTVWYWKKSSCRQFSVMRLSWEWISSQHCQSCLGIHSYFDNVMTKFMINDQTDAWKTVNLLSANQALFLLFYISSRFRRLCHRIVNLRHFDNFMLVIIMLSSITIAIEDPVNDNSKRNQVN